MTGMRMSVTMASKRRSRASARAGLAVLSHRHLVALVAQDLAEVLGEGAVVVHDEVVAHASRSGGELHREARAPPPSRGS